MDKHKLFNKFQCGFRKKHSTIDNIIRLQDDIHKYNHNKGYVLGVFLDIAKAYDMVWHAGLLFKLDKLGIDGQLFNWIKNFLNNRKIQVRVGASLSDTTNIENGTPQGSAISPVLFLIMINDIPLSDDVKMSVFADDTAIWKGSKNLKMLHKCIQKALDGIVEWADSWGFKLSIPKTQAILFTHKKQKDVDIKIKGNIIKLCSEVKFLGLIFDCRLNWKKTY
jgi:hypothetical protein